MTEDQESFAQQLYEAYADAVRWVNFLGNPMPSWESLPLEIKNGWGAAGSKAAEILL